MNKWILMFVVAAAYAGARHMDWVNPTFKVQGPQGPGQTLVADAFYKATFTVNEPVEETYMLFGASVREFNASHAWLFGLEIDTARRIAQRYPDFHLCKSPGAPEAQRLAKHVQVVADRRTLSKLSEAAKLFEDHLGRGDQRICVTLRGEELTLEQLESGGQVLTADYYHKNIEGQSAQRVYLRVHSLDAKECRASM